MFVFRIDDQPATEEKETCAGKASRAQPLIRTHYASLLHVMEQPNIKSVKYFHTHTQLLFAPMKCEWRSVEIPITAQCRYSTPAQAIHGVLSLRRSSVSECTVYIRETYVKGHVSL